MSNAYRSANRSATRSRPPGLRREPLYPVPTRNSPGSSRGRRSRTTLTALPTPMPGSTVRRLPVSRPMPTWLRLLIRLQRGSMVLAFVLGAAAIIVYSGTVYTQHLWSTGFHKLTSLQRNERQLIEAGGTMQNYLAKQAERPGAGLIPKTPASTIFLQPAPQRPIQAVKPAAPQVEPQPNKPLGY
ncbi:hypothetical protein K9N68_15215 [Kovacikia minuta CCNUW1]|uniref:hypothetical protein n=1 Tax=Kovacikia minuta TaxID=2931930 RepID=UPI001CCD8B6B|nr:hypothetical protein [Kovacikia minuta]UBF29062.1 hypothetical protein K9N68_15215 [Kovacikia minuta CCNUW1]